MSDKSGASAGGIALPGFLFLIFVTLKLLGKIDWSWWWVTSPLWIGAGIVMVVIAGFLVIGLLAFFIKELFKRLRSRYR